jgi:hypothetical protein
MIKVVWVDLILGAVCLYTREKKRKLFSDADGAGLNLRRCLFVLYLQSGLCIIVTLTKSRITHTGPVSAFPLGSLGHAALFKSKNVCFLYSDLAILPSCASDKNSRIGTFE